MWIERTEDVQLQWSSGREWNRLQALLDMRLWHVWHCFDCGSFEPVNGPVRAVGGL